MEMFGRQDGPPKSYKTRRLLVKNISDISNTYFLKDYIFSDLYFKYSNILLIFNSKILKKH